MVKKFILIVEDNSHLAEMMQKALEFEGYKVSVARNGPEAVEKTFLELPDLIVLDLVLPGFDGLQVVSHIRHNPKGRSIPVLAVTAAATRESREKILASGCAGYIAKPFSFVALKIAIAELLRVW